MPKLIPLSRWNAHHAWPSTHILRKWYSQNLCGFRDAVTLRGPGAAGRILMDEEKFFSWLESNRADANDSSSEDDSRDGAA